MSLGVPRVLGVGPRGIVASFALLFVGVAGGVLGAGGGLSTHELPEESALTSTLTGSLALGSFPSRPTEVVATSEQGAVARTAVHPDGSFALALVRGHRYRLQVRWSTGGERVVLPRASGRLGVSVRVRSGSVRLHLGTVRHVGQAGGPEERLEKSEDVGCEDGRRASMEEERGGEGSEEEADPCEPAALPGLRVPAEVGGCDRE